MVVHTALPLNLLLGGPVVLTQLAVALLQLPGGHVQLLVHLGMLVIHLPQQVHLLSEILHRETQRELVSHLRQHDHLLSEREKERDTIATVLTSYLSLRGKMKPLPNDGLRFRLVQIHLFRM